MSTTREVVALFAMRQDTIKMCLFYLTWEPTLHLQHYSAVLNRDNTKCVSVMLSFCKVWRCHFVEINTVVFFITVRGKYIYIIIWKNIKSDFYVNPSTSFNLYIKPSIISNSNKYSDDFHVPYLRMISVQILFPPN